MNRLFSTLIYQSYRVWSGLMRRCKTCIHQRVAVGYCFAHQVRFNPEKIHFYGKTDLSFHPGSKVTIGDGFICRSGRTSGTIDHHVMSVIEVRPGAALSIGSHSGISNTCIHCHQSIISFLLLRPPRASPPISKLSEVFFLPSSSSYNSPFRRQKTPSALSSSPFYRAFTVP